MIRLYTLHINASVHKGCALERTSLLIHSLPVCDKNLPISTYLFTCQQIYPQRSYFRLHHHHVSANVKNLIPVLRQHCPVFVHTIRAPHGYKTNPHSQEMQAVRIFYEISTMDIHVQKYRGYTCIPWVYMHTVGTHVHCGYI